MILGFNAFLPKTHHIDPNIQDFSRWAQSLPGNGYAPQVDSTTSQQMYRQTAPPMNVYPQSAAPQPGPYLQPAPPQMNASAVPSMPAVGPSPAIGRGANAQFNRAVSFVEKIKNRFANQPETYRAFLAILHSFHRDQRGIKEVYAQVQQLFRSEPDLLEEFSQFLPDTSVPAVGINASNATNGRASIPPGMLPPVGRFSSSSNAPASGVGIKRAQATPSPAQLQQQQQQQQMEKPKRSRVMDYPPVSTTGEENEFFDKVKRYLGNRQLYADFLKCLSLFSQDILKLPDLLSMVHNFIGGNAELFGWFKKYINYKESDGPIWSAAGGTNGPVMPASGKSAASYAEAQVPELNLSSLKRVGCYRIYPKGYRLCKASGRTLLCDEVLNDEMLSCPSFESEDSGFMASKKNQYEDALFKCEDERYEMDLLLEYNLATIAVLEPLAKKLELMSAEEREAFRLDARLNGTSEIIYKKAIKRIYGDKGDDIYEYLQRSPAAAVPVVLRRLKAKDEEWRRVQRDWNRVWAEIHIKNYYKALDHQGIDFKTADRKTLTLRSLVGEVQTIKDERKRAGSTSTAAPHLSISFADAGILKDLLGLIDVSITSGASFSGVDKKSLSRFFSTFIPEFLKLDSKAKTELNAKTEFNAKSELELLPTTTNNNNSSDNSEDDSMSESESVASSSANEKTQSADQSLLLYANDALFGVLRLLSVAYERLERMKQAATASANKPFFKERVNVVAQFLDLQTRQASMSVDEELATGRDFYGVLLYLLGQLIEGEIEPGLFEEKVRYMFGTGGYLVFTFDKVLLGLLRQCLGVLNDGTCENLIRLYDSWRTRRGPRTSEYSARLAAENIVSDSNNSTLFRIEFSGVKRLMTIHLMDRLSATGDQLSSQNPSSIEEKWSLYVDNFVKLESNPAYLNPQAPAVFLKRNCLNDSNSRASTIIQYNLECKICINTYKIFYVENTEDLLVKRMRRLCTGGKTKKKLPF